MDGVRSWWSTMVVLVLMYAMAVMVPQVSGKRWTVGGNRGWTTNVNYTIWAQDKHFYNEDWLFFVYDRNQMDVLEVNRTDYESCNSDQPLHNWTTGAGRDVVPLNVTRDYYFISGEGFCYSGVKVAIHVENIVPPPATSPISVATPAASPMSVENPLPPPTASPISDANLAPDRAASPRSAENLAPNPAASPTKAVSGSQSMNVGGKYVLSAVFTICVAWGAFVQFL